VEILIIILLSLVVTGCTYIIWNLNSKVVEYENRVDEYETWITNFSDTVKDVNTKLKDIDSKGTFESDDEVGTFFTTLKTLMGQITDYWEK
tara:strand:+ start:483 stop:755 length:273 start_codon:yes stop_codon:yes gene_type:complete